MANRAGVLSSLLGLVLLAVSAHGSGDRVSVAMMNLAVSDDTPIGRRHLYPAAQLALEAADVKNVELALVDEGDDCCTRPVRTAGAQAAALYDAGAGADAFLGPAMSPDMVPVAEMAAAWNLPVLSGASTSTVFGDEDRFPTLVRAFPSFALLTDALLAYARQRGVNQIVILRGFTDKTNYYSRVMPSAVFKALEDGGLTVVEVLADQYGSLSEAVQKAASLGEVVLVSKSPVVDVLREARKQGITSQTNTFLYWYPQDFQLWQSTSQFENLNDADAAALDNLLVMRVEIPRNPEFGRFQSKLKELQKQRYGKELGESYFAAATHDVLLAYAQVVDEIAGEGGNVRDGKAIVNRMKNRSFSGALGNIRINDKGDRDGVCEVLKIKDKKLTVVSTFDQATQKISNPL